MKFQDVYNSSTQSVTRADTLIVASGFESRARASLQFFGGLAGRQIALAFDEHLDALARPVNDKTFAENDFDIRVISRSAEPIEALMSELVPAGSDRPSTLIVDISSMTRTWYAPIIRYLLRVQRRGHVVVNFVYVPPLYSPPPDAMPQSEVVEPLPGFLGLGLPDRPLALILGLGYEPERALALREFLDPARGVVFLPREKAADRYYEQVLSSNAEVLQSTLPEWTFEYHLEDPVATFRMLESVVSGLRSNCRVVAASLGPKLFALECLLVGSKHPEMSVWWVSAGSRVIPRDIQGDIERIVVCRTEWI